MLLMPPYHVHYEDFSFPFQHSCLQDHTVHASVQVSDIETQT